LGRRRRGGRGQRRQRTEEAEDRGGIGGMNVVSAYDADDQLICDLQACKAHLFNTVSGSSSLFYLKKEHAKMKKSFDYAFKYKLSSSLIVVGSSGDETLLLIKSVLDSYKNDAILSSTSNHTIDRFSKLKNYTARVSGSMQLSDHEALVDMANQFMVRNEKDSNANLALEDLEELFKHCRQDGIPAIIVLEDFHVFAKRSRQTLIYTLLDLMHKKEMLFMVSLCVCVCVCVCICLCV
jgi:Cdc6-like AAA superfamily ATPase